MSKKGFFRETETHRRLMRGESIPAHRPPQMSLPEPSSIPPMPEIRPPRQELRVEINIADPLASPEKLAEVGQQIGRMLDAQIVGPGRYVLPEEARAAALRVRSWLQAPEGEQIETADLQTLARWVIHQTRQL